MGSGHRQFSEKPYRRPLQAVRIFFASFTVPPALYFAAVSFWLNTDHNAVFANINFPDFCF
jgi:hypothetical protein